MSSIINNLPCSAIKLSSESDVLNFLAEDMKNNPGQLLGIDEGLAHRLKLLVGEVEVDLNQSLSKDDDVT